MGCCFVVAIGRLIQESEFIPSCQLQSSQRPFHVPYFGVEDCEIDTLVAQGECAGSPTSAHHGFCKVGRARLGGWKDFCGSRPANAPSVGDQHVDFGMFTKMSDLPCEGVGHEFVVIVEEGEEFATRHFRADPACECMRSRTQSNHL